MKEKIPVYNIINMFFVGAVFSLGLCCIFYDKLPFEWLKENTTILSDWWVLISIVLLIAMYEFGLIINRMSSIIVEPIYSKTKLWPKDKYKIDVSELSQINSKFQSLITDLVLMRSHIMMYFILMLVSFVRLNWLAGIMFLALVIIFTFGGKKHNAKINRIREDYKKQKEKEEKEKQELIKYFSNT